MGLLPNKWTSFGGNDTGNAKENKYDRYSVKSSNKLYFQSTTSVDNINSSMTDYPEFSSEEGLKDIFHDLKSAPGTQEVEFSWKLIEEWLDASQSEIELNLSGPCSEDDLKDAQAVLRTRFPKCVIQSLLLHDGQSDEQPSKHGLMFGLQLMCLDEIVTMTQSWRKVYEREQILNMNANNNLASQDEVDSVNAEDLKEIEKTNQENINQYPELTEIANENRRGSRFKLSSIPRQTSIPPNFIQESYAHPAWIPLVTDYSGNHIGIDLSPGPEGLVGQVILFGRDFDTKYAVAPNWGDFLLMFAKDLEQGSYAIRGADSLTGEADLVYILKSTGRDVSYLDVLKQRVVSEYEKVQNRREQEAQLVDTNPEDTSITNEEESEITLE